MSIALNIAYGLGLAAASPYVGFKMLTDPRWRKGFAQRLGRIPGREGDAPCLWVHCASVGETLAARELVGHFSKEMPGWEVAVSTITPEGNRQARKHFDGTVFYFPIDFTFTIRKDIRRIRPSAAVLVEKELWPNFLRVFEREKIPVFVVNGVASEGFLKRYRALNRLCGAGRRMLNRITVFCVQTQEYADRLLSLGVRPEKVRVTGNLKYDTLCEKADDKARDELRRRLQITPGRKVIVGGSTHPGEEKILLEVFGRLRAKHEGLRLILVPRHITRLKDVQAEVEARGFSSVPKSALDRNPAPENSLHEKVIIVDTIGELVNIYALASVAFVGGSLVERGGHNVLEPAALGVPTLFGPHVNSCRDSADLLLGNDAAKTVRDAYELEATLQFIFDNPVKTDDMTGRARESIAKQKGATGRTVEILKSGLGNRI